MADDRVEVQISATTQTLQDQLRRAAAVAEESFDRMRAAAAQAGNGFTAIDGALKGYSPSLMNALNATEQVEGVTANATAGMRNFSLGSAQATRELIVLGHEVISGNFSRIPGSLIVLTERMGGLSSVIGALASPIGMATAAAAAMTGALGYLAIEAERSAEAVSQLKTSFALAGDISITEGQINGLIETLSRFAGIGRDTAQGVLADLSRIPDAPAALTKSLNDLIPALSKALAAPGLDAKQTEEEVKRLADTITRAFQDSTGGTFRFAESFHAGSSVITADMLANARAADRSGNENQVFAAKLQVLLAVLDAVKPRLEEANKAQTKLFSSTDVGPLAPGQTALQKGAELMNKQMESAAASARFLADELRALPQPQEAAKIQADNLAASYAKTADESKKLGDDIKNMKDQLAVATPGSQLAKDLEAGIAGAQQKLDALNLRTLNEKVRDAIVQIGQTQKIGTAQYIEAEIAKWNEVIATAKSRGLEDVEAEKEIQHLKAELKQVEIADARRAEEAKKAAARETAVALRQAAMETRTAAREAGQQAIADAQTQIAEIQRDESLGAAQKLQAAAEVWQQLLMGDQLNAEQRRQVTRALNSDMVQLDRQMTADRRAIAQSDADADVQIAKISLQEKKAELDAEVAAHRITAQQRLDIEREMTRETYALEIQALQNELSTLQKGTKGYEDVYNKIRVLRAQLNADLAALDRSELDSEASDWKAFYNEISSASGVFFNSLLLHDRTFGQAAAQSIDQILTKWIQALAQMLLQWSAFELATESGWTKLASAIGNPFSSGSGIGGLIGDLFGVGKAAQLASATGEISTAAAVAAANTFASTAAIPIVGPELAPGAAAAAYAQVMGYQAGLGLASLDVGAWEVPRDMPAFLHQGEMVVPTNFAQGVRENGGFPSGNVMIAPEFHIHAIDTQTGLEFIERNARFISQRIADHWRFNPNTRPDF